MDVKVYLAGVLSALVLVAISFGAYTIGKNTGSSSPVISPTPQPDSTLQIPSPASLISPTQAPQGATKDKISESISDGDYGALAVFMTNPVSVRLEASECCQPMTPTDAIVQLEYLDNAQGPWDFENDEVIAGLEASYPEYYGNAIIGISSDDYVVGIQLNAQNFITQISMGADYKLLLP